MTVAKNRPQMDHTKAEVKEERERERGKGRERERERERNWQKLEMMQR